MNWETIYLILLVDFAIIYRNRQGNNGLGFFFSTVHLVIMSLFIYMNIVVSMREFIITHC